MHGTKTKESDRYYLTYQRSMLLGLLFVIAVAAHAAVNLLRLAGGDRGLGGGWILMVSYLVALVAVQFITLRGRRWRLRDPEVKAIFSDEWVLANRSRAYRTAFWAMICTQWPAMFLAAELPGERSVIGMSTITVLVGLGAFFATYLYLSRQPNDG